MARYKVGVHGSVIITTNQRTWLCGIWGVTHDQISHSHRVIG